MNRTASVSLAELLAEVRACRRCVEAPDGPALPHEPRPVLRASATARILIAGQAPGTRVHASGVPFSDPSGNRLRAWMGVSDDEFYDDRRIAILPMGFCFPGLDHTGSDIPPRVECAALWRHRLMEKLPSLRLILAVGGYAIAWHLPDAARRSVGETVWRWREIVERPPLGRPAGGSARHIAAVMPLPHPSWRNSGWLNRNPWFEAELVPELRRRVRAELNP
ncbi:MAG: uracil-DNA glycosylase family protein [Verrucomicrobiae bacterium]|nr:uracil-DNA glycosylase family protein [Verrucomicrobiae bacterium]